MSPINKWSVIRTADGTHCASSSYISDVWRSIVHNVKDVEHSARRHNGGAFELLDGFKPVSSMMPRRMLLVCRSITKDHDVSM